MIILIFYTDTLSKVSDRYLLIGRDRHSGFEPRGIRAVARL
jgi:hypothetical protein